jgi:hypothetical protein
VDQLKREVSLRRYEVDPLRVAEEIITKLRLVRRGRQALGGVGRSRGRTGGRHGDH